jgi:hypothetical protein
MDEGAIVLEPRETFDPAIVGMTAGSFEPVRVIYDVNRCIEQLVLHGTGNWEEAQEFFEYNTIGAYIKNGPLFVNSLMPLARMKDEKKPSEEAMHGDQQD